VLCSTHHVELSQLRVGFESMVEPETLDDREDTLRPPVRRVQSL
jgi:hypothetical protein